ncbi:MAG: Vancomycin B-type resistance protein VanW [Actinomycetia bacterium]|nr:Vancomycin B-type resistance protein VanW [Actinomycetes bacterium]
MPRKLLLGLGAVVLAVVALVGVAYAVDRSRGVALAGREVTPNVIDEVAAGYGDTKVVVHTPDGDLHSTAAELGITVDVAATRTAADDAMGGSPIDWVRGLTSRRTAPLIVVSEAERMRSTIRAKDPTKRTDAVEPSVEGDAGEITVKEGKPGEGLHPTTVADALRDAARSGGDTIEADVEPEPLAPEHTMAEAERVAAQARRVTAEPLDVRAGTATATIGSKTLRSWVRSDDDLHLALDDDAVLGELADALAAAKMPATDASIHIEGGSPVIVRGTQGTACCTDEAPERILAAILHRPTSAVTLPVKTTDPDRTTADIETLKIVEPIGTFTTRHPAGQPRVTNIHRIADLIDGTLIGPGGRFSVNDKVGERTTDKGFVTDHSIADGVFVDTVGGGISQFATTLFNASFFAGLDIPEYQAHSIYISRYPYGREATLSWPKPDLVIHNTTPYGVLIDTSYTGTSLTVTLWSTKYAEGKQTAQSQAPAGNCTRVSTERTRTYVDGHTSIDHFGARYRPKEGVQC